MKMTADAATIVIPALDKALCKCFLEGLAALVLSGQGLQASRQNRQETAAASASAASARLPDSQTHLFHEYSSNAFPLPTDSFFSLFLFSSVKEATYPCSFFCFFPP